MKERHPLTGLYAFDSYFSEAETFLKNRSNNDKTYCMVAIDIEHFRLFNQIHGEKEGDRMLQLVSDLLREYEKEHDCILGYLGDDKFSFLTEYDRDSIEKLRQNIREVIRVRNKTTGFPTACGVFVIKDYTENVKVMYNHAIVALSYVKGNYTTRYGEYDSAMDGKKEEEIRLLSEIHQGIERDEFTFFIQPQVDITKSKIVGGESLVRWFHGQKGMISPGVFIPVMEKNGFIADLDQIVWEKVCAWLRNMIDRGYKPVPISVNVSRIDIFSLDVPKFLISLVEKYDISPELVKVEITESAYAEDGEAIIRTVNELRDYGFIVMMDDFGSGYSSLNMLKSVPVDVLKMDMRFLEINENEEEKGVGILESVVNMARQMRIPIVVEGVEDLVQENLLRKMGCCYTQGFYYYRPMSIDAFEEILSDDSRLDHTGFWYRQAESIHLREFLDTNLFNDTVINNIIGPAVFYEMVGNNIEITRVNNQYFELAGIPRHEEEDYRKRFWNSVRDDDRALLNAIFEEAYAHPSEGGGGFINFVRRDGLTLWIYIRVYFLREKDGHRLFYAALTDMTSKKVETTASDTFVQGLTEFSEEHRQELERCYGSLPTPFGICRPLMDDDGRPHNYEINFANEAFARIAGGDIQRLESMVFKLFAERKEELLNAICAAAFDGLETENHIYSAVSNQYYDLKWYQFRPGYACCMIQNTTHAHIYESVSENIMRSFREVYFLSLKDNYCRMIYPYADDMIYRGNFEELINRGFEKGKIRPGADENNIREFLSLENLARELRKKDSVEYRYKRSVYPAGEEWCATTISVSERKDGIPTTAVMTIRSIESLMREKESDRHMNMAKMLGTMSDGYFIYRADGDEKILYANPPIVNLFGCKNSEEFKALTGNTFGGFVHPEDYRRVEWEIKSQIDETDRNMDYIRYRIIRKDGEVRWVDDVGHLESSENVDAPEMFYVFVSDITDEMTEAEKHALILESKHFNKII